MRKLKLALTVAILLFASNLFSQVDWSFKTKKINDSIVELELNVNLGEGWHIYSQHTKGTELPIEFNFEKSNSYKRIGLVKEPKPISNYDRYANDTTRYFENKVKFTQRIKVLSEKDFTIKGDVYFQLCEKGSCIPPDGLDFIFNIKGNPKASQVKETKIESQEKTILVEEEEKDEPEQVVESNTQSLPTLIVDNNADNDKGKGDNSMLMVFLVSLGAGLLTLLTPCVFPMIPMTISFFMKGNKNRKQGLREAYFFGASIIFMFAVLGLLLTLLLGKDAMYIISTHWVPNVIFFIIFMLFAFSFFGLFEITLPSSWINKSDKGADQGGYMGAFFIALTTVLVSFSCTGPILGAALMGIASSSTNSIVFFISMIGFALGFALPFTLLAMFPQFLSKLKSGSWLNTVKIVFGFLEVALGLKFLSMADLSAEWGLLDRETYLVLWIVVFTLLGFYLLGKLKFKGDAEVEQIGVGRLFLSIITFSFALYMIPGLWGAPLKAISGYIPPMTTQDFNIERSIIENTPQGTYQVSSENALPADRKYVNRLTFPSGFEGFFDLEEAKAYAKKVGKPIFLDFTGKTCANCREMEYYVWEEKEVKQILTQDYVMVALYTDANKVKLEESEWVTLKDGTVVKTLGKKNHNYQIDTYNVNAQPLYVLLDADGNLLNEPKGYDKTVENFISFLEEGKKNFKK